MTCFGFRLAMLFFGALAVTAAGCGRAEFTFYPVEGTVTKGGRPLHNVKVVFLADPDVGTVGPRASGRTDESGHYRLRTDKGNEGAVAGRHRVLVLDNEVAEKAREGVFDLAQEEVINVCHVFPIGGRVWSTGHHWFAGTLGPRNDVLQGLPLDNHRGGADQISPLQVVVRQGADIHVHQAQVVVCWEHVGERQ